MPKRCGGGSPWTESYVIFLTKGTFYIGVFPCLVRNTYNIINGCVVLLGSGVASLTSPYRLGPHYQTLKGLVLYFTFIHGGIPFCSFIFFLFFLFLNIYGTLHVM